MILYQALQRCINALIRLYKLKNTHSLISMFKVALNSFCNITALLIFTLFSHFEFLIFTGNIFQISHSDISLHMRMNGGRFIRFSLSSVESKTVQSALEQCGISAI